MVFPVETNSMIPNPNLRVFVSEPTYTEKILKEAFEYYKLNKSIINLKMMMNMLILYLLVKPAFVRLCNILQLCDMAKKL
jgi:hypothetical protein